MIVIDLARLYEKRIPLAFESILTPFLYTR